MSFADNINIVDGQAASGSTNTGNPVKVGAVYNATPPTVASGDVVDLQADPNGNLKVVVENGVTSGTAGSPASAVLTLQGIAGMTPIQTAPGLQTSGGASYSNAIAPATPSVATVKGSAGNIYQVTGFNSLSVPVYIKFFDAPGAISLGTTAASFQFMVPGNTQGCGCVVPIAGQRSLANSIKYAVTGAIAYADNTAITANSVIIDIAYN